jgi:transcriptional regulator with XRE-family HTH domain
MKYRVKECRKQKGLSQIELGKKVGKAQGIISAIEVGKQTMTTDQVVEFAKALEVHPVELLMNDPHWSAPHAAGISAPHLRIIFRTLAKLMRKYPTLPEEVAADVLTSLYRQYVRHHASAALAKHIETDAEVLIKHGMTDRS